MLSFQRILQALAPQGGIHPAINLDFTTSVPASVSVARTGTLQAIVGGVFTTTAANTGRVESWNSINRGLKLDPAITNLLLRSGSITTAPWNSFSGVTRVISASTTLPDGTTGTTGQVVEVAGAAQQTIVQGLTLPSAGTYTLVVVWKPNGRTDLKLKIDTLIAFARAGTGSPHRTALSGTWTNAYGYNTPLANGWWMSSVTGTTSGTAGQVNISPCRASDQAETYTGDGVSGVLIWYAGVMAGAVMGPKVDTAAASAASNAETATIADISGINTTVGTFLLEYNAVGGVALGSGVNTLLTAGTSLYTDKRSYKVAIAYDGTDSRVTQDGGTESVGGVLTFGADLRLLATSGGGNSAHIKSLKWYVGKLTSAQRIAITTPDSTTGGTNGALRVASSRNRLPKAPVTLSGTVLNFATRAKVVIGSGNRSSLRFSFQNWYGGSTGEFDIGNNVIIDKVSLERETGGAAYTPVTFTGSRSKTLAAGDRDTQSDAILPSAFGAAAFVQGDVYWMRIKGHVTTAGHFYAGSRFGSETGMQAWTYDSGVTSVSDPDGTGVLVNVGAATIQTWAFTPIVLGNFSSGDPATYFNLGASQTEGTVGGDGSFFQSAFNTSSKGVQAALEMASGGASQINFVDTNTRWQAYLQYARVGIDELGINAPTSYRELQDVWYAMRQNGISKIVGVRIPPVTTSTDSWKTELNQTYTAAGTPGSSNWLVSRVKQECVYAGYLDYLWQATAVKGVDVDKWVVDGVTNFYATTDGGHMSLTGISLATPEAKTLVDTTITVPTP